MRLFGEALTDVKLAPDPISPANILMLIAYLLLIVVAAYFLTKFLAKRSLNKGIKKNRGRYSGANKEPERLLSIEDRIAVDKDKTLVVAEFDGKRYLLGVTGQDIRLLDRVEAAKETKTGGESGADESESEDGAASLNVKSEAEDVSFAAFIKRFGSNFKKNSLQYFKRDKELPADKTETKKDAEEDDGSAGS